MVVGQLGSLDYSLEVANDLHEALPATPIIVAARSSSDIDPDKLLAAGISDVVRWPILTEEIAASLSQFSNASGPSRPSWADECPEIRYPSQLECRMTLQKLMGRKLGSLSARTSALTLPNVVCGLCSFPL